MSIQAEPQVPSAAGVQRDVIDLRVVDSRQLDLPKVTVIVPTRNEAENLPHVLPFIPSWVDEVIIVDGNSTDGTCDVALELLPKAVIITEGRPGKGQALCTGFENATGELIVAIDADGSCDPLEIPAFVGSLLAGADLAKGSRFIQGGGTDDMELHRKLGNWALTVTVNRLFGGQYSDLCYGYFALRRSALPSLVKPSEKVPGFEIETLLNIRALTTGLRISEVASFEYPRIHGTSNLKIVRDGMRIARVIVKEVLGRTSTS